MRQRVRENAVGREREKERMRERGRERERERELVKDNEVL